MQRTTAGSIYVTLTAGTMDRGQVLCVIVIAGLVMATRTLRCAGYITADLVIRNMAGTLIFMAQQTVGL